MLVKLSIQNYAIIDELEVPFSPGLNILTGETGAGKSIIMGALSLILGERADSGVLLLKDRKSVVEGTFNTRNYPAVKEFLDAEELDVHDELVIRREIAASGKSRAFINDTPVNLSQLSALGALLVDLHQQFDTLALGESDFQREVLDALAGNAELLHTYRGYYREWQELRKATALLLERQQQFNREADYNRFLYTEFEEAAFRENELEEIDAELKLLGNAEGIKTALNKAYYTLEESDTPLVQQLKSVLQQLSPFGTAHPDLAAILQRLQAAQVELKDIADEIDRVNAHINFDPARMEQMNERLSLGYRLQKKHGVNSTAELLAIQAGLEKKLQAVLDIDAAIIAKQQEEQRLEALVGKTAAALTTQRKKQVKPLEDRVNKLLLQVGMPNAKLKVELQPLQSGEWGADAIEFLFDANKSGQFLPVRKVASGGELSRLMLCIKSLVAQSINLPTLIFDEIDTGISGEAARQVGIIMKALAGQRQVICITHQPQIAGKADRHLFVYKENRGQHVKTAIRVLDTEERIARIAQMLSGEKPTAAALENAREMVMG